MKYKKALSIVIGLVMILGFIFLFWVQNKKDPEQWTYNQTLAKINEGEVKEIYLTDKDKIKGRTKDNVVFMTDNPRKESFKEDLLKQNIQVHEGDLNTQLEQGFSVTFPLILLGGFLFYISKKGIKQTQSGFNKFSTISAQLQENVAITFENVAGNDEAKESVKELVEFIRYPEKFAKYGARMPRGIIFYGPPGTGKTLMAKALAGEAGVPFYAVSGSDFVQVYVGVGASRIRDLFKKAKQHGKCVIFIDEIDALGKKRDGGPDGGNDERDQTLNALLTEMSGFQENEGIIVIAATNRLDMLDEALLRPGRFDRHIEIGLPDVNARYEILKLHSKNKLLSDSVNLKKVAVQSVYFSGAKLESMMNEAAIFAAKRDAGCIEMCDIDKAFYSVVAGSEKKDRSNISISDKRITAYHEAGHALVTSIIAPENRVTRITIIPTTRGIGGFSMNIPPDRMHYSKRDMENNIKIALAGRAAEEIIFGKDGITSGASSDIEKATDIMMTMLVRLGMGKDTGLINYDVFYKGSHARNNEQLLKECKSELELHYKETKAILLENIEILNEIAETLIEVETIDEETLRRIMEKHQSAKVITV